MSQQCSCCNGTQGKPQSHNIVQAIIQNRHLVHYHTVVFLGFAKHEFAEDIVDICMNGLIPRLRERAWNSWDPVGNCRTQWRHYYNIVTEMFLAYTVLVNCLSTLPSTTCGAFTVPGAPGFQMAAAGDHFSKFGHALVVLPKLRAWE